MVRIINRGEFLLVLDAQEVTPEYLAAKLKDEIDDPKTRGNGLKLAFEIMGLKNRVGRPSKPLIPPSPDDDDADADALEGLSAEIEGHDGLPH